MLQYFNTLEESLFQILMFIKLDTLKSFLNFIMMKLLITDKCNKFILFEKC